MTGRRRPLSLALQGGGAHGAFTWGVLDRLLESGRFDATAITGTSAGAINSVALAAGLAEGGPAAARRVLHDVWSAVGEAGPARWLVAGTDTDPSLIPPAKAAVRLSRSLSPYQLNPLGTDPLKDILERSIDFELLRSPSAPRVGIAATNALTGRLRIFDNTVLSVDAVLASACLPAMHQAVIVDDEPYWDGGYSANPPLWPLLYGPARDVLMVLICPVRHEGIPKTSDSIRAREAEFAFTSSFLRESELLAAASRRALATPQLLRGALDRRLARIRWHLLDAGPALGELAAETRMIAHGPFLESLKLKGREAAQEWLRRDGRAVGRRASADLASLARLPRR